MSAGQRERIDRRRRALLFGAAVAPVAFVASRVAPAAAGVPAVAQVDDTRELLEAVGHAQDVIKEALADARRRHMSAELIAALVDLETQAARTKRMILAPAAAAARRHPSRPVRVAA